MSNELTSLSLSDMRDKLRAKEFSSQELVQAHLDAIAQKNDI